MAKKGKDRPKFEHPIEMFYPTSDDWSPNFPRNTVEIRVIVYHTYLDPKKGMIRIVVRGADDTGMERDMHCPASEYDARVAEIRAWIRTIPNPVTKQWLLGQGFQYW